MSGTHGTLAVMKAITRYCSCGAKFTVRQGVGVAAAITRFRESHEKLGHLVTERPPEGWRGTKAREADRWWVA